MKHMTLAVKIFLMISLLSALQILVQSLFSIYFLESFYEKRIENKSYHELQVAAEKIDQTDDIQQQIKAIIDYTGKTNHALVIVDDHGVYHLASEMTAYDLVLNLKSNQHSFLYLLSDRPFTPRIEDIGTVVEIDFGKDEYHNDIQRIKYRNVWYNINDYLGNITDNNGVNFAIDSIANAKSFILTDYSVINLSETMSKHYLALMMHIDNMHMNDLNGVDINTYKFISYRKGDYTYWSAISAQPVTAVVQAQNAFQGHLFIVMLMIAVIVAWLISRIISKPIVSLTRQTDDYLKLNVPNEIKLKRSDEIGQLTKSVHILAKTLKEKIEKLEDDIVFEKRQERIRKQFVSDVSHELKTPLGVIKSYSEGMLDGIDATKQSHYLAVIIEEIDKMNQLIVNMLDLSYLESKNALTACKRINLKYMIENIYARFIPSIEDNNIELTLSLDDVFVTVDVKKYEIVISNIIANALRYVDDNRRVIIRLTDGITPCFCVENSCEVLESDDYKKVWDRFYRVDKSRSKAFGGSGLGLSIVKQILDLHHHQYHISKGKLGFKLEIFLQ